MTVRVRFAPSPTGFLHLGNARAALFNWLWARKNNGTFILRIEDTDMARNSEEASQGILDSLRWLGLDWDEGPYYQSQRLDLYAKELARLLQTGAIYPAFEPKEILDAARDAALAEGRDHVYDRAALKLSAAQVEAKIAAGEEFVYRFRVPDEGDTIVPETLMGDSTGCKFENARIGDFVLTRPGTRDNPGMPLFNFVCAVDDADMGITHVIRGSDHLSNAAKQVLILRALGHKVPVYTHLPLIMKNGKKMKKRDADADPKQPVSVMARRDIGFLPEATVNFLALLGWSFPGDRELFPVADLIENFTLDRLVKSQANFDEDKYLHQNGWYIRNLPPDEIVERAKPFLRDAGMVTGQGDAWLASIIQLVLERCVLLSDFPEALRYFFETPAAYDDAGLKKLLKKNPDALDHLAPIADALRAVEPFNRETTEAAMRAYSDERGLNFGIIAQPVRLAITGRTASPGLFEVLELLGKDESISRIAVAAEKLPALA